MVLTLGLGAPAAASPEGQDGLVPVDIGTSKTQAQPTSFFDWTTYAHNHANSSPHRVLVASGRNGGGTREWVYPGGWSSRDADSVYVWYVPSASSTCTTYLNGKAYKRGWVNTAWWRNITIVVSCW